MTDFIAQRVSRSKALKLHGSSSQVFPLFNYIHEDKWAPQMGYEMIYPRSGVMEEGAVFRTRHSNGSGTIWTINKLDYKNFLVEYLRFDGDCLMATVRIRCKNELNGTCTAIVSYTFTTLSPEGNNLLQEYSSTDFEIRMKAWEKRLNTFLRNERMVESGAAS